MVSFFRLGALNSLCEFPSHWQEEMTRYVWLIHRRIPRNFLKYLLGEESLQTEWAPATQADVSRNVEIYGLVLNKCDTIMYTKAFDL